MATYVRAFHAAVSEHKRANNKCNGLLVALSELEDKWGGGRFPFSTFQEHYIMTPCVAYYSLANEISQFIGY